MTRSTLSPPPFTNQDEEHAIAATFADQDEEFDVADALANHDGELDTAIILVAIKTPRRTTCTS